VRQAWNISLNQLDDVGLAELGEAMWSAAASLLDDDEDELLVYDLIVRCFDKLTERTGAENLERKIKVASSLLMKGVLLSWLQRNEEAIPVYD
jgi:hypothetical protein